MSEFYLRAISTSAWSICNRIKTLTFLFILLLCCGKVGYAAVVVTPATGGINICSNKAQGGGAFNTFLMIELQKALMPYNVQVVIPDAAVVKFKEALVMALIGTLRWREEVNVMSSVTGAARDSVGGELWIG